jgi:hypothetical protein
LPLTVARGSAGIASQLTGFLLSSGQANPKNLGISLMGVQPDASQVTLPNDDDLSAVNIVLTGPDQSGLTEGGGPPGPGSAQVFISTTPLFGFADAGALGVCWLARLAPEAEQHCRAPCPLIETSESHSGNRREAGFFARIRANAVWPTSMIENHSAPRVTRFQNSELTSSRS